jgi:hypothetical protein
MRGNAKVLFLGRKLISIFLVNSEFYSEFGCVMGEL